MKTQFSETKLEILSRYMERRASMTMTNHYSGRVSRAHHTAIRLAIGAIVMIAVSLIGQVPASAQTSDANSPPSSSNSQSQTSAPMAGKKEQVGRPRVLPSALCFSLTWLTAGYRQELEYGHASRDVSQNRVVMLKRPVWAI